MRIKSYNNEGDKDLLLFEVYVMVYKFMGEMGFIIIYLFRS